MQELPIQRRIQKTQGFYALRDGMWGLCLEAPIIFLSVVTPSQPSQPSRLADS